LSESHWRLKKYFVTGISHKSWACHQHTVQRHLAIRVDISFRQHRIQESDTCNHIAAQLKMIQAPSSVADGRASGQEITHILRNPQVHYLINNISQLDPESTELSPCHQALNV
jgi:hypothetical protein